MEDKASAANGAVRCTSSKRPLSGRLNFLIISILIIFIASLVAYLVKYDSLLLNGKTDDSLPTIAKKSKTPAAKAHTTDIDAKVQQASQMVRFIDHLLESNLDDTVTVEQSIIRLRDVLRFNSVHFAPRISSIVKMDPFKFAKFNLKRPCTLWPDVSFEFNEKKSILKESFSELDREGLDKDCPTNSPKALSELDRTLSKGNVDALNVLFECSRDDSEDSQYYDLILNPERFTGYDGYQIWKAIYEENCFPERESNIFSSLEKRCYEERVFYRSISGLHTSITTHLTSLHHKFNNQFGHDPHEYYKRFFGNSAYLKNLFFVYLIELRALYKSQPYLLDKIKWKMVGDKAEARDAIKDLLKTDKLFKWHFDENVLFTNEPKPLAQQLAAHFHNITFNIMDCVSCDKCRLWGKVQTNGLGTAFKILLTKDINQLRLSHHEITCLLNSLARLSHSINAIDEFRNIFHGIATNQPSAAGVKSSQEKNNQNFMNFL
ncbi:oxidoreductase [Tyrophagus putrescentiae]|nr:oxidoreductase [Tyrophagus putrescentiae]